MGTFARPLALAALLGVPAGAQTVVRAAVAPLPLSAGAAPIHPALLSPDGPAGSPMASLLADGARAVSIALYPAAPSAAPAAMVLQAMAAAPEPAQRAAAGVLARALTDTRETAALLMRMPELMDSDLPALAGRRLPLGAAAGLAESARRDPSISFLFDGRAAERVSVPAAAALDGETLVVGSDRTEALGRGFFGVVHPHPSVEGAVIKTDLPRGVSVLGEPASMGEFRISRDRRTMLEAERVGVGPRLLGDGRVGGRPALVKERVYGPTVARLLEDGEFTAEDHALVEAMFLKIARSGISFVDVRPENIMIGRTLASAERRAYLIDGGEAFAPSRKESPGDHAERLFGTLRELVHPPELLSVFDAVHFTRARPD